MIIVPVHLIHIAAASAVGCRKGRGIDAAHASAWVCAELLPDGSLCLEPSHPIEGKHSDHARPAPPSETAREAALRDLRAQLDDMAPVGESGERYARVAGDYLAVQSAGAYGFVQASNYNSRPRGPEILVEGSSWRVIRARETYDDLVNGETI